jgi:hypothetical protein
MSDVMPRVILDELVALAVHHLGDGRAARDLVDQVLAEHPDLAAAAVEAPSPAERLQAVDRLFGRVRWAVRDRLPGVASAATARPANAALPAHPPMPTAAPAAAPSPAPAPSPASDPSPAPGRPASPPWAPTRPQQAVPSDAAAPRSLAVPPAATIPQLEPPRTFIPTIVAPGAEPEARVPGPAEFFGPPLPEVDPPLPEVDETPAAAPGPGALDSLPPEPARPEPPRHPAGSAVPAAASPPAAPPPRMRPRPAPPREESAPLAPLAPHPSHHREPPPLQVEIVDDLYGIEAASRRRRRVLIGLAGLAAVAGAAWLVVLADLPQVSRDWEWPGSSPASTTAEAPPADESPPASLEALELESPDVAADQPNGVPANGTRLALGLDQAPEPAAGPTAAPAVPGEEAARVFIHYDADAASASAAAAALYARLAEAATYATVVLRDVPYAIGSHRVRYYHAADRPAAMALIERLGSPPGTDWQLQDFSNYRPLPVRGTLEVFVPTD